MKKFRHILEGVDTVNENLSSSSKELAKEIDTAARKESGSDKTDYQTVAKLISQNKLKDAKKIIAKLDTVVLEDLITFIMGHEDVFKAMYPRARPGQYAASFARKESVEEGTLPPALQAYQDKKNGKKKKDDKDEDVKEHTISIDEQIIEALKAGKGKGVADIDYVGDPKLTKKIEKMFKVKIKQTGTTTADVTGEKKNILTFLQKHYYYDNLDVMELHPEIVEANESTQMKKVSDMSERAMTLKQIAQKYKGEISKSQKSGNPDLYLKKAEKELVAWAMDNNEISGKDSDEEDDWLANVVSDKTQFDALLKFSRT